ncbi:hypothetical protein [Helicobacter sp. 23-1045]
MLTQIILIFRHCETCECKSWQSNLNCHIERSEISQKKSSLRGTKCRSNPHIRFCDFRARFCVFRQIAESNAKNPNFRRI